MPKRVPLLIVALLSCSSFLLGQAGGYGGIGGFGGTGALGPRDDSAPTRMPVRAWAGANGFYTTGAMSVEDNGVVTQGSPSYGAGGSWGVSTGKSWRRTSMGGAYVGNVRIPIGSQSDIVQGVNSAGSFSIFHQMNREVSVTGSLFGGSALGGYGYGSAVGGLGVLSGSDVGNLGAISPGGLADFGDPNRNGLVDDEYFNNRTTFLGANTGIYYTPTMRWSFGGYAGYSIVGRSGNLYGQSGYGLGARAAYRLSRSLQIGAGYSFGRFQYPNLFGGSQIQSIVGSAAYRISRNANIAGYAGVSMFHQAGVGQVQLDPVIAELLGVSTTAEIIVKDYTTFTGGVQFGYQLQDFGFSAGWNRGMTPGNGLLLATNRDTAYGTVSYGGVKRVGMSASIAWNESFSMLNPANRGNNTSATGSINTNIVEHLSFNVSGGRRWLELSGQPGQQSWFIGAGIYFTTGSDMLVF